MGLPGARDLLGCSYGHHLAAGVACFRAEIDDPIGAFNYFKVMLDHDQRVTGIHQALEGAQQHRNVVEV